MSNDNMEEDDEQHLQAFGRCYTFSRNEINRIKSNEESMKWFTALQPEDAQHMPDLAWQLLGRYISNNTHLESFGLPHGHISHQNFSSLFSGLVKSSSLSAFYFADKDFGIDKLREMVPFFSNAPNLSILEMGSNHRFDEDCFDLLISTLQRNDLTKLHFNSCNITGISALETYDFPNLQSLQLNNNEIGREGCIIISNLLRKESTMLKYLYLVDTGMGDEEADILATSLKSNNTLKYLLLAYNKITQSGYKAFLKLLADISSIENTYKSNHTLDNLNFSCYHHDIEGTMIVDDRTSDKRSDEIKSLINRACAVNRIDGCCKIGGSPMAAGRAKVIKYQLDSLKRKEVCHLQGIEYSFGNLLADFEPILLPSILALIGSSHGQSELYTALVSMAPELMAFIDRKTMLKDVLAKNKAHATALAEEYALLTAKYEREMACLTAHDTDIHRRLELVELGDTKQSGVGEGSNKLQRS